MWRLQKDSPISNSKIVLLGVAEVVTGAEGSWSKETGDLETECVRMGGTPATMDKWIDSSGRDL